MSLFNSMRTAVSGMAAQSNALSAISDNIANSSTVGYKDAQAQFETVLDQNATSEYESGGVQTDIRYGVSTQGTLETTNSSTDMAINGNGFFVVSNGGQGTYLTRAGSFVPDSTGNLVNTAGYQLQGYKINPDGTTSSTLSTVNINNQTLQAAASTTGTLTANLPSTATAVAANTPGTSNSASTTYTDKTSITVYDDLGTSHVMDVYLTKTGNNTWEAAAYPQADASASGGFPYSSGGTTDAVATPTTLKFDPTTGNMLNTPVTMNIQIPGGQAGQTVAVNLSATTQLASSFAVTAGTANGNAPSKLNNVKIGTDGTVTEVYASGYQLAAYKIPLATVESPTNLTNLSGNVYQVSQNSGPMVLSTATTNGTGSILADTLEESTVDLATELTNMISAQRSYEANSKVLQAASDLLGNLNRLTTN
jgi:flagellar hook protein FlgE